MVRDPDYITPAEIAKILKRGRATVYSRLLRPGPDSIPYHQIGRSKLVGREAFFRWLNSDAAHG